jgi:MtaA/CmuA family methyltransferase
MTPKERLYATLNGQPIDRTPVTPIFMAWAAHYIGRSYRDYYLDGDVLAASQLAVTRTFNVDQISAISDPWREASAYGMTFTYPEEGVGKPDSLLIQGMDDVRKLPRLDPTQAERMVQRIESVRTMARTVGETHSVLGWVEGPLAEYADLRGVENAMLDLVTQPEMFIEATQVIIDNAIDFARAQVEAGADMIGIGDAAASLVGPDLYETYALPAEKRLIAAIHKAGGLAKLHICGNTGKIVHLMAQTGADVIDLDWMVPLAEARQQVGEEVTLCGNFDPAGVLLQGTPQAVAEAARACIEAGGERFILMPGCEVPPGTSEENLRAFCPCEGSLLG